MRNFELKYKSGPGGDQCTTYDIVFYKDNVTVREFISFIVSINAEEYGEFYVYYTDPKLKDVPYLGKSEKLTKFEVKYKYGKILPFSVPKEYLDKYIDINANNWANGGWSAMSYWLFTKE